MTGALTGRVALVTGASAGIGAAAAMALAQAGAAVAVSARRAERLAEVVARIRDAGGQAAAIVGDVGNPDDATRMVDDTVREFGRIDILINNAGVNQYGGIEHANFEEWRQIIDTNLMSAVYTCKAAIAHMKPRGSGDIINISSTAARRTGPHFNAYCASKFGLWAMTECMRQEVAPFGIRVCDIEPGFTTTEISEGMNDPNWKDFMRKHVTQEGAMKPEDVAATIVFVASLPPRANIPELQIRPTIDAGPV